MAQRPAEQGRIICASSISFKTFQDSYDPTSVVMVVEVTDLEKLGAIMNDSNNKAAKDRHAVLEPIIVSMQVQV